MFDPDSRYANLPTAAVQVSDGEAGTREVRYVRRRFLPPAERFSTLAEHAVTEGDRLDNVAARYLGEPTRYWLLCDANNAMHPGELEEPGGTIRVPVPPIDQP